MKLDPEHLEEFPGRVESKSNDSALVHFSKAEARAMLDLIDELCATLQRDALSAAHTKR